MTGAADGDPCRSKAVGISRGEEKLRSVITATSGALKLITAISNPLMAVNEAQRLNGSSASDEAMASSLDGRETSEAIERGDPKVPSSHHNVVPLILSLQKQDALIIKPQDDPADRNVRSGQQEVVHSPRDGFELVGALQGSIPGFAASPLKESSTPPR